MRAASITWASGRGLGPEHLEFFGPQVALAYRLDAKGLKISISSPQGRPRREPAADEGAAGNRAAGAISEILGSSPLPPAWGGSITAG
jgi:hypothetical protein